VNPGQVRTWESVEAYLQSKGFVPTQQLVDGGRIWRSKSNRHMAVPEHVDGFFPEVFWIDLIKRVAQIVP
jgi:hypothetical protein